MSARKPRGHRGLQRRTNLPVFLTSFVGRDREIEDVRLALDQGRLVTLVSPGGAGKTRLAVRVAQELAGAHLDAVRIVDFAGIGDFADVAHQVALALGLDGHARPPLEEVVRHLERRAMLLLLDNCEHVSEAVVELALAVLTRCPQVRILATSRVRLGVAGEVLVAVPALSLPPAEDGLTAVAAAGSEAVGLFVDRARSIQPGFALTDDNARLVGDICARLEGVPLAIELAAARLRMLSLDEIWERLDDRFRLLVGGPSGRQATLLATIEWSHHLLTEPERRMFRRLSVFPNGFRFEAAVHVGADVEEDVLDLLGRLVDKSFVQVASDSDGRSRYRMLESLREYGLLRLDELGETGAAQAAHFEHYLAMAEIIAVHHDAPDLDRWLDRVEADHDNFRAALAWGMRHSPRRFKRLAGALGWFWQRKGDTGEGRRWVEAALAIEDSDPGLELDLLLWASALAAYENDWPAAARHAGRALDSEAAERHPLARARAQVALGNVAFYHGAGPDRLAAVRSRYLDACRLYTELGSLTGLVSVRLNLCMVELVAANFEAARGHAGEAMALAVRLGWRHHQQSALGRFGAIALVEGSWELAGRFFRQALRIPNQRMAAANALSLSFRGLACVAAAQRRYEGCALLLGAAGAVSARDVVESPLPAEVDQAMRGVCRAAVEALGEAYDDAYGAGARLSEAEAVERALAEGDGAGPPAGGDATALLSRRELEIARLVADGLTNREISQLLCISRRTVDSHLDHIRNKLGLRTRTQLARWLLANEGEPRQGAAACQGQ
jgi:predicted ATPase/DNA-binding CsgD family transcriptional regulator